MRKLFEFNLITLDGYFEGPNRDISWHNVDEEFNEYAIAMLNSLDMLLFGRVTYELMASYWPTQNAMKDDPIVAGLMNRLPKAVFSRSLAKADWNNTRLVKDHVAEEVQKLKELPGKDLAVFGSANLLSTLIQNNLIDEHRIIVNPLVLGQGSPLFNGFKGRMNLKLTNTRTFKSGNVLLCYQPAS